MLTLMIALGLAQAAELPEVMSSELERAMASYAEQEQRPHYAALQVDERSQVLISAEDGALTTQKTATERYLDVDLRVGTPELDSTHQLRGFSSLESDDRRQVPFPLDDTNEDALRHTLWKEIDRSYRQAAERIVMIHANLSVKVEEESPAADFIPMEPHSDTLEPTAFELDEAAWSQALTELSARIDESPSVTDSHVSLQAHTSTKTFVDSVGTRLVHGSTRLRLSMSAQATAADGDVVHVYRSKDVHDASRLPDPDTLDTWAAEVTERLEALVAAERGQPYSGPVLLAGKAAGVFFHEVMGHRVEGHRQKREYEGKTFADYVGKPVLPSFIDVYDDPTIAQAVGEDLNGHYAYDDEGTPAARAHIVEDGVFVGFLMSRSPIPGFEESNGHGRRLAGYAPVARMGNTIVTASESVSAEALRAMLIKEVRAQGRDYGILVEEIDGGFTLTGRMMPNAFNVRASASWRVYADGRPDELVRGIDLVGTPFVAFSNLVAASDERAVFNGQCGAESGWVPVSAVAPSLLFRRLEFQLKEKGQERPPLLPKPAIDLDGAAEVSL